LPPMKPSIILASRSPRRQELLKKIGLAFKTVPPRIEEGILTEGVNPEEGAALLSRRKAESVAQSYPEHLVIGADTVVALGHKLLGKPASHEQAMKTLKMLSGREHRVITGLSLIHTSQGLSLTRTSVTRVWLAPMEDQSMEAYLTTGEPMDKAGAYAIQGKGAIMVERIEGCYSNVVGLSLNLLAGMLREAGLDIWELMRGEKGSACA